MNLKIRHLFAFLAFVIPTIIIGFGYKYGLFHKEYQNLGMYRKDIAASFGIFSMVIQGAFWAYICSKLFLKETFMKRSLKLFAIAFPLGLSFNVFMVGAKHTMTSLADFVIYETGFTFLMYLAICPLISLAYYSKEM